jgi:hypothetical protein
VSGGPLLRTRTSKRGWMILLRVPVEQESGLREFTSGIKSGKRSVSGSWPSTEIYEILSGRFLEASSFVSAV